MGAPTTGNLRRCFNEGGKGMQQSSQDLGTARSSARSTDQYKFYMATVPCVARRGS